MSFALKDFSMYLSHELIQSFGEPYQSSITTVRRFTKDNRRVFVNYELERNSVNIHGMVPIGGVALSRNDALAFIEEIQRECPDVRTFRMSPVENNLSIFPVIEFSIGLEGTPDDTKLSEVIKHVERAFSELSTVENVLKKYKKKEVGYPEIKRIWEEAKGATDPDRKGKLFEKLFVRLLQIDGNFIVCEHNVKTKSEEIDIVIQSNVSSPFWSGVMSPLILLECKNWKDKVGAKEVRDFAGKIENRPKLLCRIGFLVALSGFTSDAEDELLGYRARDFVLATVTGGQVKALIKKKELISDLLQKELLAAGFR